METRRDNTGSTIQEGSRSIESDNDMRFQLNINLLSVLSLILVLLCLACSDAPSNKITDHPIRADVQSVTPEAKDTPLRSARGDTNATLKKNSEIIQFEKITGLKLPSDAQMINFSNSGGIDEITKAKMKIPISDFEKWISTYALEITHFSDDRRYLLGQNQDWWDPLNPKTLPTAQVNFENGTTLNIGYNEVEPKVMIIYLVFHSK